MKEFKKNRSIKTNLHQRNKNRKNYDLPALQKAIPKLSEHIILNKYGNNSIDFSNPIAVKLLNKALLNHYYNIKYWEFPDNNLCPPIPGRADYIHYVADLLEESNNGKIPKANKICCFDIGVGASCIYPIIGVAEYGWNFICSDIDRKSISSAQDIVNSNSMLQNKIECRLQTNSNHLFYNIIGKEDKIDLSICNPPFHSSDAEAKKASQRKIRNLHGKRNKISKLNFSGINKELVFDGGEYKFIENMINESRDFSKNCFWFSTLVSKSSNLHKIYKLLRKIGLKETKTINMGTGNKSTRIVAWTFLSKTEQMEWKKARWKG